MAKGGFYPSIMGGVLSNGPALLAPAMIQGVKLLRNNKERMRSRKNKSKSRDKRRTRSKRTSKVRKNTRKA
jgi:hypothetical protein